MRPRCRRAGCESTREPGSRRGERPAHCLLFLWERVGVRGRFPSADRQHDCTVETHDPADPHPALSLDGRGVRSVSCSNTAPFNKSAGRSNVGRHRPKTAGEDAAWLTSNEAARACPAAGPSARPVRERARQDPRAMASPRLPAPAAAGPFRDRIRRQSKQAGEPRCKHRHRALSAATKGPAVAGQAEVLPGELARRRLGSRDTSKAVGGGAFRTTRGGSTQPQLAALGCGVSN